MSSKMSCIWVSFSVEGIHQARKRFPVPETYLSHAHRHQFHIDVEVQVFHDDREIEFIAFSRWLKNSIIEKYGPEPCQFEKRSCENLADEIIQAVQAKYGEHRFISATVAEDGENGGTITYFPEV